MPSDGLRRAVRRLAAEFPPARWAASIAARLVAPRQPVGAVGVVFDAHGRVLLLEHAFRTDFPWGLPGGWVARGEDPREAVARELREELGLDVEVKDLVASGAIGRIRTSTHPVHLGLAFYCVCRSDARVESAEVLAFEWVDPMQPPYPVGAFQREAIAAASELHARALRHTSGG